MLRMSKRVIYNVNRCFTNHSVLASLQTANYDTTTCIYRSFILRRNDDTKRLLQYPTHQIPVTISRGFRSSGQCQQTEEETKRSKVHLRPRTSFFYDFKFFYCYLRAGGDLVYHLGTQFLQGAKHAFFYISDCLLNKDYEELVDVVTPELLTRIKGNVKLRSKASSQDIFKAGDVYYVKFVNIDWNRDTSTKINTLEIELLFGFFEKIFDADGNFNLVKEAAAKREVHSVLKEAEESGVLQIPKFANVKFLRTYGEDIKTSPWIVKDLYYFTVQEARIGFNPKKE